MNTDKLVASLLDQLTTWGLKLAGVLVALFIGWTFAGWVRRLITTKLEAREFDVTLSRFFANIARYAVLAGVVLGCLGVFGVQTASFAALLASAGLAIGLAFQGSLSNFAAGVMLLAFRPFKVGDWVQAGGAEGAVREIELFTTELTSGDNKRIIVPNTKIFADTITNFSHFPTRRVDVVVGVEYGATIDRTREVLLASVAEVASIHDDPAPQAFLKELGDSAVIWVIRVWTDTPEFWVVHQAVIRAAKAHLDEAGLGIPFPQMDVHLDPPQAA